MFPCSLGWPLTMCVRAHLYDSTEPAGVANIFQADRAVVYPLSVMWVW